MSCTVVHLAVLDELLRALKGHFTDATGACVQALAVVHLVLGECQQQGEVLAIAGTHVVLGRAPVHLQVFP